MDLHSNTAVPFASLSMADHGQLVANVDGEITIMVKKLPVDIQISCIGYQSAKLTLQSNMQHILCQLSPVEIVLEEIAMHTNPGLAILEAAYQKASSYHANKYYAKAFMRQLSAVNNSYEGIQETFFDATFTNYGITGWHPRQFRYSKSKQAIQFSNFNFLSFTTIGYLSSTVVNTPMLANIDAIYNSKASGLYQD